MGVMITTFLTFLLEHADLVNALWEALDGAADPAARKAAILKAIRQAQVDATNAVVAADLGPRP
jgi:hypothetical protein